MSKGAMNKAMLSTGASLSMRPGDYKRKVRLAMGVQELTRQEAAAVEHHFDRGSEPAHVAGILLQLRRCDRNRRAMAEAMETFDRYGVEL